MPTLQTRDGAELYWEERGSGPAVLMAPYWMSHPSIFDQLVAELSDCRTITYDQRGTGQSSRRGPYDVATTASDMAAVCEAVGGVSVALCMIDAGAAACRVALESPEVLADVLMIGGAPFGFRALEGSEGMAGSRTVVDVFLQQLENDYRGAVHSAMSGADPDMGDAELRERVAMQIEYVDGEAAAGRCRAWAEDDGSQDAGRAIGGRLHILLARAMGDGDNTWFPSADALARVVATEFPEASLDYVEDGIITEPAATAEHIRQLAASRVEQT